MDFGQKNSEIMSDTGTQTARPGSYQHSAALFDLRYAHKNYAQDCARFVNLIRSVHPAPASLLDVACGTGRHLEHLAAHFRCEGLDRNSELLRIAGTRIGNVPLHEADMTDFDLGRSFDVVSCFFGSIACTGHVDLVRKSILCMARHLSPDGILFMEPYLTPDVYREGEVVLNERKTPDISASWMYIMRRRESIAAWEIHWLVGARNESVTHFVENEEMVLLPTAEYAAMLRDAGLDVVHHARGLHGYGAFVARKRPWPTEEAAEILDAFAT